MLWERHAARLCRRKERTERKKLERVAKQLSDTKAKKAVVPDPAAATTATAKKTKAKAKAVAATDGADDDSSSVNGGGGAAAAEAAPPIDDGFEKERMQLSNLQIEIGSMQAQSETLSKASDVLW